MRIDILTVVPELLASPLNESILKRAHGILKFALNRYTGSPFALGCLEMPGEISLHVRKPRFGSSD